MYIVERNLIKICISVFIEKINMCEFYGMCEEMSED